MARYPKVSIIIPLYIVTERFFQDLLKFEKLKYPNFEILIVCDQKITLPKLKGVKARLILTGQVKTGPAEKRDIAIAKSEGDICAFIDDDAYPHELWLKKAVGNLTNSSIVAVGGPGVTPPEDGYREQLTGLVYESILCSGHAQHRFLKGRRRLVRDYPAYNLIIKKSALKEVGGYGNHFYGGEDTFLCLKLIKKGFKIIYDPQVLIFHHRRPLFVPYLKQIANIGLHRGYFARVYPETSFTLTYFTPSLLSLGFLSLFILSLFSLTIRWLFLAGVVSFWTIATLSVIRRTPFLSALVVGLTIILTHLAYGLSFIRGFFTRRLSR